MHHLALGERVRNSLTTPDTPAWQRQVLVLRQARCHSSLGLAVRQPAYLGLAFLGETLLLGFEVLLQDVIPRKSL